MTDRAFSPLATDAPAASDSLGVVYRQVACPSCGALAGKRLIPSLKFNLSNGLLQPSADIWIEICQNCGVIHENPQVDVTASNLYREKHYYNAYNQIAVHDSQQRRLNPYRWATLESRIDWGGARRVLDVGASGAWSAWVKAQAGSREMESLLVEPSAEAVAFCRAHYPEVQAIHGPFEEFDAPAGSADVISLFHSLYVIGDPKRVLEKCRRTLAPDGRLIVVISHVLCEIEIWGDAGRLPWLDLDHVVRGVPLVYYSRRTLAAMLDAAGFDVVDAFATPYPSDDALVGRHDYWVVAQPRPAGAASPSAMANGDEARWAERFLTGYCEQASRRSIQAFFAPGAPGDAAEEITVLFDNPDYRDWVCGMLRPFARRLSTLSIDAYRAAKDGRPPSKTTVTLNAAMTPVGGNVIDCLRPSDGNGYGYFVYAETGALIPARAFTPFRRQNAGLFPFPDFHENAGVSCR